MKFKNIIRVLFVLLCIGAALLLVEKSPLYYPKLFKDTTHHGKSRDSWLKELESNDLETKVNAIIECGNISEKKSIPTLQKLANSSQEYRVRAQATYALGKMAPDSKVAIKEIMIALKDENDLVRYNAAFCMNALKQDAISAYPVILECLKEERNHTNLGIFQNTIHQFLLRSVGRITSGTDQGIELLLSYMDEKHPMNTRITAICSLGDVGDPAKKCEKQLKELQGQNDFALQQSISDTLTKLNIK